jgi:hypothetical protein
MAVTPDAMAVRCGRCRGAFIGFDVLTKMILKGEGKDHAVVR